MKMPEKLENIMLAPCGVNCMICYKHCNSKDPCGGCLSDHTGKPKHCSICNKKLCSQEKGINYCHECNEFPCKLIKYQDKSYRNRYGISTIRNSLVSKEEGINNFMASERDRWTCSECGGVISLQDMACSECQLPK